MEVAEYKHQSRLLSTCHLSSSAAPAISLHAQSLLESNHATSIWRRTPGRPSTHTSTALYNVDKGEPLVGSSSRRRRARGTRVAGT